MSDDPEAPLFQPLRGNQPTLATRLVEAGWQMSKPDHVESDRGHGRMEKRSLWHLAVSPHNPLPGFPSARQMILIVRERCTLEGKPMGKEPFEICYAITSCSIDEASPAELAAGIRGHWGIENRVHWIRDVTFDEDRSCRRRGRSNSAPRSSPPPICPGRHQPRRPQTTKGVAAIGRESQGSHRSVRRRLQHSGHWLPGPPVRRHTRLPTLRGSSAANQDRFCA